MSDKLKRGGAREYKRGQRVPGSKYFREFCRGCGDPIRVPREMVGRAVMCQDCVVMTRAKLGRPCGPKVRLFK